MNTVVADRKLIAQDRCDSCGAQAKVVATFLNGELLFCGHHARENYKSLIEKALNVYDPEKECVTLK
jgi:Zn ribbon nucleic-acid-binding protein